MEVTHIQLVYHLCSCLHVLFLFLSKYVTKMNLVSLTHCVIYSALFTPGETRISKNIFFIVTLRRTEKVSVLLQYRFTPGEEYIRPCHVCIILQTPAIYQGSQEINLFSSFPSSHQFTLYCSGFQISGIESRTLISVHYTFQGSRYQVLNLELSLVYCILVRVLDIRY